MDVWRPKICNPAVIDIVIIYKPDILTATVHYNKNRVFIKLLRRWNTFYERLTFFFDFKHNIFKLLTINYRQLHNENLRTLNTCCHVPCQWRCFFFSNKSFIIFYQQLLSRRGNVGINRACGHIQPRLRVKPRFEDRVQELFLISINKNILTFMFKKQ